MCRYLLNLSGGRLILWCYFLWYCVVLVQYFDANPRLWLTSIGLSLIIGLALYISTAHAGNKRVQLEPWQTFRLFLMPFCVSSFSALVKGRGFVLIFSPNPWEIGTGLGLCALLCGCVFWLKARNRMSQPESQAGLVRPFWGETLKFGSELTVVISGPGG
jgi:hypothetical protein